MADKVLSVRIEAKDLASKTFLAVANSAERMGDDIERAGDDGERALDDLDRSAQDTGRTFDDLERRATAVGAAIGTMITALSVLGQANREQERQIDGINRLYGDQADEILEMTENIQDFTRYSNDAARESALLTSSLANNYGMSADQITLLVERSADLAQIYGISLPDAVQRTSAALRGEGEGAEILGLNLSDAAVAARALDAGITDWNVPGALSEAEKASFRLTLFLEDTESTIGAAADAADNAGGRFRQFINTVQDGTQALGGFLGPVGEVAAELAPIAIALPVIAAGFGSVTAKIRASSTAMGALTSPIGAFGIAAGVGTVAFLGMTDAINDSIQASEDLDRVWDNLMLDNLEESATRLQAMRDLVNGVISDLGEGNQSWLPFATGGIEVPAEVREGISETFALAFTDARVDTEAFFEWINSEIARIGDAPDAQMEFLRQLADPSVLIQFGNAVTGVEQALLALADVAPLVSAGLSTIQTSGEKMGNALLAGLSALADVAAEAGVAQGEAIENFNTGATDFLTNGENILEFWLQYKELANQGAAAMDGRVEQMERLQAAADFRGLVELANALDDAGSALDSVLTTFDQIDSLGQRASSAGSIVDNLIGDPGELAIIDDLLSSGRISLEEYNSAVASGYAIQQSNLNIQEDLNAMRADQLPLLESEIAAYEAQIDAISQLPPLEQRRALAMQDSAVQAQIAQQYAVAYSATLGEIPPEVATNMIVSAAEADPMLKDLLLQFGLIEEGAEGEIRVNFPDGPTVQDSIMMLTDSIDALTIAMGGVPPLRVEVDTAEAEGQISTVMDQINEWGGLTSTATVDADTTPADNSLAAIVGRLMAVDGQTATVSVNAIDNASGPIGWAAAALDALNGRTATTYVQTVYSGRPVGPSAELMGGVPGFEQGGVTFYGGEGNRPELARFANGGVGVLPTEGYYSAPPMTRIVPNNGNNYGAGITINAPLTINAPIYGVDDLDERFAQHTQQMADALERNRIAAGVY